jgi:hypothetical protein
LANGNRMQFDRLKFKQVVLYVISLCLPERLGAVKLNKILYFCDMLLYAWAGHPLTGATYKKRPHGPTTDDLLPALRDLQKEGLIHIGKADYFGYIKTVFRLRGELSSLPSLNDQEKQLISDVTEFVANQNTAKTISELSHNLAWEMAEFGAELPYYSAFALFPTTVFEETVEWAKSKVDEIETARQKQSTMDYKLLRDIRRSVPAN